MEFLPFLLKVFACFCFFIVFVYILIFQQCCQLWFGQILQFLKQTLPKSLYPDLKIIEKWQTTFNFWPNQEIVEKLIVIWILINNFGIELLINHITWQHCHLSCKSQLLCEFGEFLKKSLKITLRRLRHKILGISFCWSMV